MRAARTVPARLGNTPRAPVQDTPSDTPSKQGAKHARVLSGQAANVLDAAPVQSDHSMMKKYYFPLLMLFAGCQSAPVTATSSLAPASNPAGVAPVKQQSAPAVAGGESAASILVRLRNMTMDSSCSSDAQCHTVGVGARACGGPAAYLAYSTAGGASVEKVSAVAAEHSRAQAAELARRGEAGVCSVVTDPGATCVAQVCKLRTPASDPR